MAPPKRPWLRLYVETFADVELRVLPVAQRWTWLAVLAIARTSPVPGALLDKAGEPVTIAWLAEFAGVTVNDAKRTVEKFKAIGSISDEIGILVVANWDRRQFESDDVASRVAKHRRSNSQRNDDVTPDVTTKERASLTGAEIQRTENYSSSCEEPRYADDTDDDNRIRKAAHRLAITDLAARQTAAGDVRNPDAWIAAATKRRTTEIGLWLNQVAWPILTEDELVARFTPKPAATDTRVSFDETPEQQLARLRTQRDLVDDDRDREAITEQIHDLEQRMATTDR